MLNPRPSEIQGRIVRAATALFARQGFRGTSTREIARLADVSEVTIFRYFEHKDDIFWSALESSFDAIRPRLNAVVRPARLDTPEVMLPEIVSALVDIATLSPELVRLIAVALLEMRGRAEQMCRDNLTPLFAAISSYLSRNIESGKVRNLDPAIVTAAIALTVIAQPELSRLIEGIRSAPQGNREAIDAFSSFWLDVLVPATAAP
jgi:AcrR family transcriptional regulator